MENGALDHTPDRSALDAHSVWVCAMSAKRVARKPSESLRPVVITIAATSVMLASLLTATASFGSTQRSGFTSSGRD